MTTKTTAMALLMCSATTGLAQPTSVSLETPSRDRWNYPFNFAPGVRTVAPSFGATEAGVGFDDRDAQFAVGWDTAPGVPAGEPALNYQIISARVTVYIAAGDQMVYDPTYDEFRTHLLAGDPDLLTDTDAGRPIEIFPAGYRGGFDLMTWEEFSQFGTAAIPPAQEGRNIFPANIDGLGNTFDISNHVKGRYDPEVMAVGQMPAVTPGDFVPFDAEVVFDLDVSDQAFNGYLRESLAAGRVNLVISSLHFAAGGPDGGAEDPQYAAFYTKEDPAASILGLTPTLELTFEISNPIDFNGDGFIDNGDIGAFISLFLVGDPAADLNGDGFTDNGDIGTFVQLFLEAAGG